MTLQDNDLYSETSRGPLPRIQPRTGPGAVTRRMFKQGTGTLPIGTPCYVEAATGFLVKIDPSAALGVTNDVYAIVWPAPVTLASGNEVLATVMEAGAIHYDDIAPLSVNYTPAGTTLLGTLQQLKDVLRKPSNRTRGIIIEGLDLIGGNAGL